MKRKINLPTASQMRRKKVKRTVTRNKNVEFVVAKFLNGEIREAMNEANESDSQCINVEVPMIAYGHPEFFDVAIAEMKKLGFKAEKSHDGGGMYATLFVSWDKKA